MLTIKEEIKENKEENNKNILEINEIILKYYNLEGSLKNLGSCQDINYQIKVKEQKNLNQIKKFTFKIFHENNLINDIQFQINSLLYLSHSNIIKEKYPSLLFPLPQLINNNNNNSNNNNNNNENNNDNNENKYYEIINYQNEKRFICLYDYIDGIPLSLFHFLPLSFQKQFGELIGTICLAFSSYQPYPNEDNNLNQVRTLTQWDMRYIFQEISKLQNVVQNLSSIENLNIIENIMLTTKEIIETNKINLREQVIHGDLAYYNIIATKDSNFQPIITGIIDFGDTSISWVVSELVIALLSSFWHLKSSEECFLQAINITKSFHSIFPLNYFELTCLWPLLLLRSIHILYSLSYELQLQPDNQYNLEQLPMEWNVFHMIRQINLTFAIQSFQSIHYDVNSNSNNNDQSYSSTISTISTINTSMIKLSQNNTDINDISDINEINSIDLSTKSSIYQNGNWENNTLYNDINNYIISNSKVNKNIIFVSRYGDIKFYSTTVPSIHQPKVISLFTDVFLPIGTKIYSPFDGILTFNSENNLITINISNNNNHNNSDNHNNLTIFLLGINLNQNITQFPYVIKSNEIIGEISSNNYSLPENNVLLPPRLNIQISTKKDFKPPYFCEPDMFIYWNQISPSPEYLIDHNLFLNLSLPTFLNNEFIALNKRKNFVASVQEHYYKEPPYMVRGWKDYMYDNYGRGYLDMVNNVTVLGHCHPAVTNAAISQLYLLNTNSRFIYDDLGEYAEMILSTLPKNSKLKKVFFVNSGSEATDLALRIARTVVSDKRKQDLQNFNNNNNNLLSFLSPIDGIYRDTICFEGGYHGITTASDEVSTTLNDNPIALESRPPWIHLIPMPNKYRGKYCNEINSIEKYIQEVELKIKQLNEKGTPISVFISEPLCGNSGGVELPYGYLKQVYELIHSAGGLCICDEVQVGYGRLGNTFWGFLEHDIEPDIITMAKATGNGYPLGFVVTTEEIAQKFGIVGSFFSSAGGSPLSCHIGKTVLQTIINENLQQNSLIIGNYLSIELNKLKDKYPNIIGCIHGHSLYQGIEIIQPFHLNSTSTSASTSTSIIPLPGTSQAYKLCEYLLKYGIICHNTGDYSNVLKVKPPLVMTKESAEFFIQTFEITLQMLQNIQ